MLEVKPGQIYELSGWVRVQGRGDATLCVTLRDAGDKVTDWVFAGQTAAAVDNWQQLRSRFIVPPGSKAMQPRLIGNGPATIWFDDASLTLQGSLDQMRRQGLPATLQAENQFLNVVLKTDDGSLRVTDRRSGHRWTQWSHSPIIALDAKTVDSGFRLTLLDPATMLRTEAMIHLDPQRPEIAWELSATGEIPRAVAFPQPLKTDRETFLILPLNEGISYPAADQTIEPAYHYLYGGHGLCMAWYGQTDVRQGVLTIVETPDDAGVRMLRHDGLLSLAPEWESQRGRFGYARRLRWVFFDDGGYVAMCNRYRQHAKQTGLLKTLAEKRIDNPNVDIAAQCARATGYAEMLSHRWLTADYAVQETRFAGGVTVTVNFGDKSHRLADGSELPPLGHRVEGPIAAARKTN